MAEYLHGTLLVILLPSEPQGRVAKYTEQNLAYNFMAFGGRPNQKGNFDNETCDNLITKLIVSGVKSNGPRRTEGSQICMIYFIDVYLQ